MSDNRDSASRGKTSPFYFDPVRAVLDGEAEDVLRKLYKLVKSGASEREIDKLLRSNPVVFGLASRFFHAGHHGCWVFPQVKIKSASLNGSPGLVPDYLIAAKSSDGLTWWVVELKGPGEKLYKEVGGRIVETPALQQGLAQLQEYISWCDANASSLRELLGLKDFIRPRGVLIIGRAKEMRRDVRRTEKKRYSNRSSTDITIRTWDALLRDIWGLSVQGSYWAFLRTLDINFGLGIEDEPDQDKHEL